MKLVSLSVVFVVALASIACDSKSDKKSEHDGHAEAAVGADDAGVCAAAGLGIHGDLAGYTAATGSQFHVKVEWSSPLKASSLENKATVTFVNEHAEPLPLTLSSFKLFMPAMGHGSGKTDKLVLSRSADAHIWSVDQIYFSMGGGAGEWVVDIEAGGCGVSDKARVVIPVEVQ